MTETAAKYSGMRSAAGKHPDRLKIARYLAVAFAQAGGDGLCTVDDVRREASRRGYVIDFSQNWTGSIFKDLTTWECAGMKLSDHKGGHARRILIWRLRPDHPPVEIVEPKGVFVQLDLGVA